MSIIGTNHRIVCDGPGCSASAGLPVALRNALGGAQRPRTADGWLFVSGKCGSRHFCPICGREYLEAMTRGEAYTDPPCATEKAGPLDPVSGAEGEPT